MNPTIVDDSEFDELSARHRRWLDGGEHAAIDAQVDRLSVEERAVRIASRTGLALASSRWVDCDLAGLVFRRCDFSGAAFHRCDLSACEFVECDLHQAELIDCDCRSARFQGSRMAKADLTRADLRQADLSACDLSGASLVDADLRRAVLAGVRFEATRFARARLFNDRTFVFTTSDATIVSEVLLDAHAQGPACSGIDCLASLRRG